MPPLSHRPFYRTMLQDAWSLAWRERRLWIVAVLAGILQTGGIIDVLVRLLRQHVQAIPGFDTTPLLALSQMTLSVIQSGTSPFLKVVISLKLLQVLILGVIFAITVLTVAILCQGALVYLVGLRGRFARPTLSEAFMVAGQRFWRVTALTLIPLIAYALGWFVFLAPFGNLIALSSIWALIAYVVATVCALLLGFLATAVHLLALQRVVLDGIRVEQALQEAFQLIRSSWFVILETAVGMFAIGVAVFIVSVIGFCIFLLPLLALVGVAIVFQSSLLMNSLLLLCELLFGVVMLGVGGFMITFQYTIWNRLFTRLSKGMAVSKVVRVVHQALGHLSDLKTGS